MERDLISPEIARLRRALKKNRGDMQRAARHTGILPNDLCRYLAENPDNRVTLPANRYLLLCEFVKNEKL